MAIRAVKVLMGVLFPRCGKNKNVRIENQTALLQNELEEPLHDESGTGSVYWGQLPDGIQIAVKRLNGRSLEPAKEFVMEAEKMGKMQHKNVLHLRGYCVERQEHILVYDYVTNSSLLGHLHGAFSYDSHLTWQRRVLIALGCAEGLAYLHENGIIHGDIKSSNVLLTDNYEPMYTYYGVAGLMKKSVVKDKCILGYTAPECSNGEEATKQSDVFSLGILILELISGRRPMEKVGYNKKQHIVDWAEPLIFEGKFDLIVDPKLEEDFVLEQLKQLVYVAAICAQSSSKNRPNMHRVVEILQQVPNK